jgi:hypothetical protein
MQSPWSEELKKMKLDEMENEMESLEMKVKLKQEGEESVSAWSEELEEIMPDIIQYEREGQPGDMPPTVIGKFERKSSSLEMLEMKLLIQMDKLESPWLKMKLKEMRLKAVEYELGMKREEGEPQSSKGIATNEVDSNGV